MNQTSTQQRFFNQLSPNAQDYFLNQLHLYQSYPKQMQDIKLAHQNPMLMNDDDKLILNNVKNSQNDLNLNEKNSIDMFINDPQNRNFVQDTENIPRLMSQQVNTRVMSHKAVQQFKSPIHVPVLHIGQAPIQQPQVSQTNTYAQNVQPIQNQQHYSNYRKPQQNSQQRTIDLNNYNQQSSNINNQSTIKQAIQQEHQRLHNLEAMESRGNDLKQQQPQTRNVNSTNLGYQNTLQNNQYQRQLQAKRIHQKKLLRRRMRGINNLNR